MKPLITFLPPPIEKPVEEPAPPREEPAARPREEPAPPREEPVKERQEEQVKRAMQNLLTHLPGEATVLYLAGLDVLGNKATAATLIFWALFSLGVLLLVRYLAKASRAVIATSVIAFVIWVYVIGNGPFQALGIGLVQGFGALAVLGFSTVVTLLATAGRLT